MAAAVAIAEWTRDDFRFVAFDVLSAVLGSFGNNVEARALPPQR